MQEKNATFAGFNCKVIIHKDKGLPVVFLHGHSYTRSIWQELGILDLLVSKHVPFLALDMPYGEKSECTPKTQDPKSNVAVVNDAVKKIFGSTAMPVLVGASLGGNIALHYSAQYPIKGMLLVAPARSFSDLKLVQAYKEFSFPTKIIWGSEDKIISGEEMRNLSFQLPNTKLLTYFGAEHSAYKQQTEKFKKDLLELYALAEQS
ncbi:MAG: alpha/beta hydrolase [Crenarchaeota archaeon]|mgnify:CR=1 FL=1|nr:alpha/beta hydrolase [Thermoproteota archaeon]